MSVELTIRVADREKKRTVEDLQPRASLVWEEYREALVAHPDAIELPLEHLDAGHTFVAEHGKQIVGFSVVLPRPDGDADLDGLLRMFAADYYQIRGTPRKGLHQQRSRFRTR